MPRTRPRRTTLLPALLPAVAAAGAALAIGIWALGALRRRRGGGGPRAHQVDGSDATAAFEAGIADENIVPESTAGFGDPA